MASKKYQAPIISSSKISQKLDLDPVVFSQNLKPVALAQAIRIYQHRSHQRTKKVKSRGQITASTRKIYRQKGTGRARHGAVSAPIFVGGGVAHGPKLIKKQPLRLNQKIKSKTLATLLAQKLAVNALYVFKSPKLSQPATKTIDNIFHQHQIHQSKNLFVYTAKDNSSLCLSIRNLAYVQLISAASLNPLRVIKTNKIIFSLKAIQVIQKRLLCHL